MNRYTRIWLVVVIALSLGATASLGLTQEDNEQPLGAAVVNIETTDNDIELQVFVDGSPTWKHLQIEDPNERRIFNLKTQRRLRQQGMSELFFASSPDAFPADENGEIDPDGIPAVVEEFLDRFLNRKRKLRFPFLSEYQTERTNEAGEAHGKGEPKAAQPSGEAAERSDQRQGFAKEAGIVFLLLSLPKNINWWIFFWITK